MFFYKFLSHRRVSLELCKYPNDECESSPNHLKEAQDELDQFQDQFFQSEGCFGCLQNECKFDGD